MPEFLQKRQVFACLIVCGLAVATYLPVLDQPFISDDYLQISLARNFGPVSGWKELASDALYRARATSLILTYWTERAFGFSPFPFYVSAILLHVANTILLYLLSRRVGLSHWLAIVAAGFFAVYEGHQEAVMWYAAVHELLVFFFAIGALLLWMRYLETRSLVSLAASFGAFLLALGSKESAIVVVPLLFLVARQPRKAVWPAMLFAAAAGGYFLLAYGSRDSHQHFNDGTFALSAPFWITVRNSMGRMLWFWGLLALLAVLALRLWSSRRLIAFSLLWMVICFLPYSFLTYQPRVPSRHTYLASAGLAWIIAAGVLALNRRRHVIPRWALATAMSAAVLYNCGYVWGKKRDQYLERAEPIERLIEVVRTAESPVEVRCFPYNRQIADLAVSMRVGSMAQPLIWSPKAGHFSKSCLVEAGTPVAAIPRLSH